jgi:polycystin 1L2
LGPLTFTPQQLFISLASSVVSIPISIIIVTLFRKAGPKPSQGKNKQFHLTQGANQKSPGQPSTVSYKVSSSNQCSTGYLGEELDDMISYEGTEKRAVIPQVQTHQLPPILAEPTTKKKKSFMLPWWCAYVAWFLVMVTVAVSGTFTMLYSFEWGGQKSSEWLTAFVLSFLESVIFVQPLKVRANVDHIQ